MTAEQYQEKVFALIDFIKDSVIRPITGEASAIETRYITSEMPDNEQWIGYLRDEATGKVDIWLISLISLRGLPSNQKAQYEVVKSLTIVIDYFADYHFGVDVNAEEETTNTEREFDKKLLALDWYLEKQQSCFYEDAEVITWDISKRLQRFKSGTCHRAHGVLNLRWSNLSL